HHDRGIIDSLVPLSDFASGQGRPTLRPPPDDFVVLVKEAFVEHRAERPPHAFDIRLVKRHVSRVEVYPERNATCHPPPLFNVAKHGFNALFRECLDAVSLDIEPAADSELFLDFDFDGKTVRIPSTAPRDMVATHGPVTKVDVLHDAR